MQEWEKAPIAGSWQEAPIAETPNLQKNSYQLQSTNLKHNHGFVDELVHGASLGTADELSAAITAPFAAYTENRSLGDAYSSQLSEYRDGQKQYRKNSPYKSFGANIAGGVATGWGGLGRHAIAKFGPYVGSAVTGGATGAAYGFADSEGGVKNRLEGGATGAAFGAILSPLIPAGLQGGKWALGKIRNLTGLVDADDVTIQRMLKAMQDDGLSPKEIRETLDTWASSGKPVSLADLGENLRGLGAYVSKQPGPGRTFALEQLLKRQGGQADRVISDIKDFVSSDDFYMQIDDLVDARRVSAKPFYEEAYKKDFIWSDKMENLLTRKPVQKALKNAEYLMAAEGRDPSALGYTFNEAGDVNFIKTPSMEVLDYIKRGMDDVVEGYRDKTTNKLVLDGKGRAFNNLLQEYKGELVKLNPAYGEALKAYAGPSGSINIIQRGQQFLKRDADIIAKDIASMSKEDLEMYKIGVAKSLYDEVTKRVHGADKAKFLINSPRKEKSLAVIFGGDKNYKEFKDRLLAETEMHKTYGKATGGSPTQSLQAEDQAVRKGAGLVEDVLKGNPGDALYRGGRMALERFQGVNDKARENMAHILFESDPKELSRYLEFLSKRSQNGRPSAQRMKALTNRNVSGFSSGVGASTGFFGSQKSN